MRRQVLPRDKLANKCYSFIRLINYLKDNQQLSQHILGEIEGIFDDTEFSSWREDEKIAEIFYTKVSRTLIKYCEFPLHPYTPPNPLLLLCKALDSVDAETEIDKFIQQQMASQQLLPPIYCDDEALVRGIFSRDELVFVPLAELTKEKINQAILELTPEDVQQHQLGDCYLLTALVSLLHTPHFKSALKDIIDVVDGKIKFTLYVKQDTYSSTQEQTYYLDPSILNTAKHKNFIIPLIEKLYAIHRTQLNNQEIEAITLFNLYLKFDWLQLIKTEHLYNQYCILYESLSKHPSTPPLSQTVFDQLIQKYRRQKMSTFKAAIDGGKETSVFFEFLGNVNYLGHYRDQSFFTSQDLIFELMTFPFVMQPYEDETELKALFTDSRASMLQMSEAGKKFICEFMLGISYEAATFTKTFMDHCVTLRTLFLQMPFAIIQERDNSDPIKKEQFKKISKYIQTIERNSFNGLTNLEKDDLITLLISFWTVPETSRPSAHYNMRLPYYFRKLLLQNEHHFVAGSPLMKMGDHLCDLLSKGFNVCLNRVEITGDKPRIGLFPKHAYFLVDCYDVVLNKKHLRVVTCKNPWGTNTSDIAHIWQEESGTFRAIKKSQHRGETLLGSIMPRGVSAKGKLPQEILQNNLLPGHFTLPLDQALEFFNDITYLAPVCPHSLKLALGIFKEALKLKDNISEAIYQELIAIFHCKIYENWQFNAMVSEALILRLNEYALNIIRTQSMREPPVLFKKLAELRTLALHDETYVSFFLSSLYHSQDLKLKPVAVSPAFKANHYGTMDVETHAFEEKWQQFSEKFKTRLSLINARDYKEPLIVEFSSLELVYHTLMKRQISSQEIEEFTLRLEQFICKMEEEIYRESILAETLSLKRFSMTMFSTPRVSNNCIELINLMIEQLESLLREFNLSMINNILKKTPNGWHLKDIDSYLFLTQLCEDIRQLPDEMIEEHKALRISGVYKEALERSESNLEIEEIISRCLGEIKGVVCTPRLSS